MSNNSQPRSLAWSQVDVFAEKPYQGNMLAIFHDATGLTTEQMQELARETNLSETTFILPSTASEESEHGVRVRIFTVQEELPFAGHPTLGTASWLYWNHPTLRGSKTITLNLNAGSIPVRFATPQEEVPGVDAEMRQNDPVFGMQSSRTEIANALGIPAKDLHPTLVPQVVSTGMAFCIVPLASVETLATLSIDQKSAAHYAATIGAKFFYCIAPTSQPTLWHARMQFYNGEDPATGSACGCAISYLVLHRAVPAETLITFRQGIEMHRPSKLVAHASLSSVKSANEQSTHEKIVNVCVSGRTIPVATGQFFLP